MTDQEKNTKETALVVVEDPDAWRDKVLVEIHRDIGRLAACSEANSLTLQSLETRTRSLEKTRNWATGVAASIGALFALFQTLGKGMFHG